MRWLLLLVILVLLLPSPARADLSDFRKDVEQAEQADPEEDAAEEDDEDDEGSFLWDFFWQIFSVVWMANNMTTTYGSYPYSADGYILWADVEDYGGDDYHYTPTGRRSHWFTTEAEALSLDGLGRGVRLTLKGAARFDGGVKIRDELEVEADDAELLEGILRGLGFEPWMRYEKDREAWRLGEVEVVLDHTPMGGFVELEGEAELLAGAARRLGLDADDAVRGSYVSLWAEERRRRPELPHDMVFP